MCRILIPLLVCTLLRLTAENATVSVGDGYEHRNQAIAPDAAGNSYVTSPRLKCRRLQVRRSRRKNPKRLLPNSTPPTHESESSC
jgi:hypothetical protein